MRYEILRRDGFRCRCCGATADEARLVVDAVIPEALGGSHKDPSNLQTLCEPCNSGKTSTNPDAPVVAQVAEDAARWADAMRLAQVQMCRDIADRLGAIRAFDNWWEQWSYGPRGLAIPRPDDWESTVETLLDAGLPESALQDCVRIAMNRPRVTVPETWRYMCGIAWKRIGDLQESARAQLTPERHAEGLAV